MKIVFPVYVVLAAMIAPAALAGTATEPEIVDDAGDAGGRTALDVNSVWFNSANPRWADRADRQLEINIKVTDLLAAAPAADGADTQTRYYYDVFLTHGDTGQTYKATCFIHLVHLLVINNPIGAQNYGVSGGCLNIQDQSLNTLLEVRMSPDHLTDVVEITISRPYYGGISLAPGTGVTVSVETAGGEVLNTAGSATNRPVRGPTVDSTGSAAFTL